MKNNSILCIDLKSFFASCECVERNIDPFKYPLVVANPYQGKGAITLAVTPYLKSKGVKSRGRLYEIPKNIKYIIASPHMDSYIRKSQEVIDIYLDFVSEEDLYIYSIDECFLDVTNYLKLYKMSDVELGEKILKTIYEKTGLTATCGISTNMLLAKIAMDIDAKKNSNNIAKWKNDDIKNKLWKISPLSEMWGIGKRMENNLNKLGIYTVEDLAKSNKLFLKDTFGVIGTELWNHANGIDETTIKECQSFGKDESFSHSQVLFKDYYENNIPIIIREMIDVLTRRLRKHNKVTKLIGFGISYSKTINDGFYHSLKIDNPTDSKDEIFKYIMMIFDKYYENAPIRKVSISLGLLEEKNKIQISLFDIQSYEDSLNQVVDKIKEKLGGNSLLLASNLLKDSTARERNKKIGGHFR